MTNSAKAKGDSAEREIAAPVTKGDPFGPPSPGSTWTPLRHRYIVELRRPEIDETILIDTGVTDRVTREWLERRDIGERWVLVDEEFTAQEMDA